MVRFLAANWIWIVVIGGFIWMHSRGGGCGMHGGHNHDARHDTQSGETPTTHDEWSANAKADRACKKRSARHDLDGFG